jgi:hypothetical protein
MLENQRIRGHWPNVLLFVAIACVLMAVQWRIDARNVMHELGDFAANSLLVLDAKHLQLLYGNYSRIGVNHPGPAILYVLAAGEWLFYDVLHIAPSPFSGQLLAVCLYSAAWFTLIFALLRRFTGAILPALLFTTVFIAAIGFLEPSVYLGIWFPDLYVLPFAAVLVALSRLAHGRMDAMRAMAVASGFLINGHVSFIPMLGVMLIVMLAANWWISRGDRSLRILSKDFLRRHKREIQIACAILFVFFIPLLILTVIQFPGPLYEYVKFGRNDKHNSLGAALKFIGVYWKSGYAWAWGVALALALISGLRAPARNGGHDALRDARAFGIAFIAATLALLYYAKVGVDHLEFVYVGLFYYSVPALAGALLVMYLYQAMRWERKAVLAGAVVVAAVIGAWPALSKPAFYNDLYEIRGSAQMYDQLRKLPGKGRIVFDIKGEGMAWEYVWGDVVALLLYARRQGNDLICINDHWQVLFTRAGQCRPDELDTPRRFLVYPTRIRGLLGSDPDLEGQRLLLYRHGRTVESVAYTTLDKQKDVFRKILGKGWSDVDYEFAWTVAPVAEINLPADPQRSSLYLDLGSFLPEKGYSQHLDVVVNGKAAGSWDFDRFEPRRQIKIDLGQDPAAAQHIELKLARPVSPKQYRMSLDDRPLGVSLYGIR